MALNEALRGEKTVYDREDDVIFRVVKTECARLEV